METLHDCPFCAFQDHDTYILMLHVETLHSEGDSPFIVKQDQASSVQELSAGLQDLPDAYVECPEAECGEAIFIADLDSHMDMHLAERVTVENLSASEEEDGRHRSKKAKTRGGKHEMHFDTTLSPALRNLSGSSGPSPEMVTSSSFSKTTTSRSRSKSTVSYSGESLEISKPRKTRKRLGSAELGPFAFEKQMPLWLRHKIQKGPTVTRTTQITTNGRLETTMTISNETPNTLSVLTQLCEQDSTVKQAFLCNHAVRHIVKLPREGGFCGYRNIQMLISYMRDAPARGFERFPDGIPDILQLQDLIEEAWDQGYNSHGRVETGGIKGTRKYIGTPEAHALFLNLSIPCRADTYNDSKHGRAHEQLLSMVHAYFAGGATKDPAKVQSTNLPPIYLQQPGHSLTIVGFEIRKSGARNLIVLDPVFKPSPAVCRLIGKSFTHKQPGELLRAYRKGETQLQKFHAFETLQLLQVSNTSPDNETHRMELGHDGESSDHLGS